MSCRVASIASSTTAGTPEPPARPAPHWRNEAACRNPSPCYPMAPAPKPTSAENRNSTVIDCGPRFVPRGLSYTSRKFRNHRSTHRWVPILLMDAKFPSLQRRLRPRPPHFRVAYSHCCPACHPHLAETEPANGHWHGDSLSATCHYASLSCCGSTSCRVSSTFLPESGLPWVGAGRSFSP